MKIGPIPPMPPNDGTGATPASGRKTPEEPPSDDAAKVSLSRDAAFLADMKARSSEARPKVRDELVEQVKAELEAGTFEENSDVQRVVNGLLADL